MATGTDCGITLDASGEPKPGANKCPVVASASGGDLDTTDLTLTIEWGGVGSTLTGTHLVYSAPGESTVNAEATNSNVMHPGACEARCMAHSMCQAFSFVDLTSTCSLYASATTNGGTAQPNDYNKIVTNFVNSVQYDPATSTLTLAGRGLAHSKGSRIRAKIVDAGQS